MTEFTRSRHTETAPLVDEPSARWLELMVVLTRGLGAAAIVAVIVWGLRVLIATR